LFYKKRNINYFILNYSNLLVVLPIVSTFVFFVILGVLRDQLSTLKFGPQWTQRGTRRT